MNFKMLRQKVLADLANGLTVREISSLITEVEVMSRYS